MSVMPQQSEGPRLTEALLWSPQEPWEGSFCTWLWPPGTVLHDGPGRTDFCSLLQPQPWTLTPASAWKSWCLLTVAWRLGTVFVASSVCSEA